MIGGVVLLSLSSSGPVIAEPVKIVTALEVVEVRVTAAEDGTVLNVVLETRAGDAVVRFPTGLISHYRNRIQGQAAPSVDWKKIVTESLQKFRKEQDLGEECQVRIAADDNLQFGGAADVAACCRRAGFKRVEFVTGDANRIVFLVGSDGKITTEGKELARGEIGPYLLGKAKAFGGPERVEVSIQAHPQAKYAAVCVVLREVKEGGYRQIRVEVHSTGGMK